MRGGSIQSEDKHAAEVLKAPISPTATTTQGRSKTSAHKRHFMRSKETGEGEEVQADNITPGFRIPSQEVTD